MLEEQQRQKEKCRPDIIKEHHQLNFWIGKARLFQQCHHQGLAGSRQHIKNETGIDAELARRELVSRAVCLKAHVSYCLAFGGRKESDVEVPVV